VNARDKLLTVREALDRALEQAYRRQSFASLDHLLRSEEAAMAACECLAARLTDAEERCSLLWVALLLEEDLNLSRPGPPHCLN